MPPLSGKRSKSSKKSKNQKDEHERNTSKVVGERTRSANSNHLQSLFENPTCQSKVCQMDALVSVGLGVISFVIYVGTAYPSVPGGDSGELIVAAHELGVSHPPGYPLFTLMSWLAMNLIPVGSLAWRVNVLNALFSSLAIFLLALLTLRLTGRFSAAVLAVGCFGFNQLTWTWSITAEVFGLNNFFTCLLLLVTQLYHSEEDKQKRKKLSILGSFLSGLALCNQHTLVIYIGCIALFVLSSQYQAGGFSLSYLFSISGAFVLGLSFYLYLPVSAYLGWARWTWGDQRSISGFIKHLLRQEYGTFDLGKDQEGQGLTYSLSCYWSHIYTNLTMIVTVLLCINGLGNLWKFLTRSKRDTYSDLLWIMMVVYIMFFSWRANLDIKNPLLLGVVERFWMQSDIVAVILAAITYHKLFRFVENLAESIKKFHLDLAIAVLLSSVQFQMNFSRCNQYNNTVVHEFGMEVLKDLPTGSIVLTKGDLPSNVLRYLYLCENVRPDISMFDQEVLTYDWSVPMMGKASPNITFPGNMLHLKNQIRQDGRQSFDFKTFLDANYNRAPIFGCIGVQEHEDSWRQVYDLWPYGVCSRFVRKGDHPDIDSYIEATSKIAENWTHKGFDETSWEYVASNEMWHAKISSAFFLYEMASKSSSKEDIRKYLIPSYKLYSQAIANNAGFPAHWYKNYALVCERLLHVNHDLDNVSLLKRSIQSFERFLELDPTDKDADAIATAVKDLKKYLKNFKS